MKNYLIGFKEVFSKPFYVLVAFSGALLFYLLNVIISDFSGLRAIAGNYSFFISMKLVFYYFVGFLSTLDLYSAFFIVLIALLFGSYISLFTFKVVQIRKSRDEGSFVCTLGVLLGFIATGCAACGVGIASVLGLGGFLIFLPFNGMEIYVIAVILLLYANISISGRVVSNACPVKFK